MRSMKKTVSLLLVAALILTTLNSAGIIQAAKKKKANAKVSFVKITNTGKKLRIQKGKKFRLKTSVKVKPNQGKYKKLKFSSSNRKIVLVNSRGLLKGIKVGTAKITAASKMNPKKKASISVTVTKDVLVNSIKLNKKKITADEFNEEEIPLKVTKILPANAKNKKVQWSTSDEDVADVNDEGVVTTGDVGVATITAMAADKGGAFATCRVMVTENESQGDDDDDREETTPSVVVTPDASTQEQNSPEPEEGGSSEPGKVTEEPGKETEKPGGVTCGPVTEKPGEVTEEPVTEKPEKVTERPGGVTCGPVTEKPETEKPWDRTEKPTQKPGSTIPPWTFAPDVTPDPFVPEGEGWIKLDLSTWSGDADRFSEKGNQIYLDEVEYETIPLPKPLENVGDKIELIVRGSLSDTSSGFRFWLSNSEDATMTQQYYMTEHLAGAGPESIRDSFDTENADKFLLGQPFHIQTVLKHTNWNGCDDILATKLFFKGPNFGTNMEGVTITGIWVRYNPANGATASEKPFAPSSVPSLPAVSIHNPQIDENGNTTWDCVYFGNYWQNDTNGDGVVDQNDEKQPIKWRVLSVDGDDAFLLADENLDCQPYNASWQDVTWETCTLRSWLNGYGAEENIEGVDYKGSNFLDNAFSAAEQLSIRPTMVVNDDNPEYGTVGGSNTSDQVYLLSIDEVRNSLYGFSEDYTFCAENRRVKNTEYARAKGAYVFTDKAYKGNGVWWLRSPGSSSNIVAGVSYNGRMGWHGDHVNCTYGGVRPALHLNLSSVSKWTYAGTVDTEVFKNKDIELDLATAVRSADDGTGDWEQVKDESGKLTAIKVNNESEGVTFPLPNKLAAGKKISVTVKGSFAAGATGFRVYTSPGGIVGGSTNNLQGLLGDAVTEGEFTLENVELEAAQDCPELCLRIPSFGAKINGLTITGIWVRYGEAIGTTTTASPLPQVSSKPNPGDLNNELYTDGDFEYKVSNNVAEITDYLGNDTDVVVPAEVGGYPVKMIGNSAFHRDDKIEKLTLSEGIAGLRSESIFQCHALRELHLPASLGASAEGSGSSVVSGLTSMPIGCNQLAVVTVPESSPYLCVKDGVLYDKAMTVLFFYPNAKTDEVFAIPDGVKTIGNSSFEYNSHIKEVSMPDTVTYIGYWAFSNASFLKKINISTSCEHIGQYAFHGTALESLDFPASLKGISVWGMRMNKLKAFSVDQNNPNYSADDGVLYNKDKTMMIYCPAGKEGDYIIPDSVLTINEEAIQDSHLTSITFPWQTTIKQNNFSGFMESSTIYGYEGSMTENYAKSHNLSFVSLGKMPAEAEKEIASGTCGSNLTWSLKGNGSLTICGTGVMEWEGMAPWSEDTLRDRIRKVVVEEGVKNIADGAFQYCATLSQITLPSSITEIGVNAFYGCSQLTELIIPEHVTEIKEGAFGDCLALKEITVPASVERIASRAFSVGRGNLEAIKVDPDNPNYCSVDGVLFDKEMSILIQYPSGRKDACYKAPEGVQHIADCAFSHCIWLDSVVLPDSVVDIGDLAFYQSTLDSIILGEGLVDIGRSAFHSCSSLKVIGIGGKVKHIGNYAFAGCYSSSLKVYYSSTKKDWEQIEIGDDNIYLQKAPVEYERDLTTLYEVIGCN